MDENELRRKMQAGELAANNGTVMRTLAIAGCDFKFLKLKGLLLALAFFGFRCLVTVPCFFLLAAPAMGRAAALRGLSRGRRCAAFSACGRGCWLGFGIVCLILCLGAWIELRLSPFLLHALLERFF